MLLARRVLEKALLWVFAVIPAELYPSHHGNVGCTRSPKPAVGAIGLLVDGTMAVESAARDEDESATGPVECLCFVADLARSPQESRRHGVPSAVHYDRTLACHVHVVDLVPNFSREIQEGGFGLRCSSHDGSHDLSMVLVLSVGECLGSALL